VTGGTLLEVQHTRATALEAEVQGYYLNPTSEFDGYGLRVLAGPRWFWDMDKRWRPNVGVGGFWSQFFLDGHSQNSEPKGGGVYGDVGLDWMVTPTHAIGLRLRGTARYEAAEHEQGIKPGVELSLQSAWRF
jgi:hypothetical protein